MGTYVNLYSPPTNYIVTLIIYLVFVFINHVDYETDTTKYKVMEWTTHNIQMKDINIKDKTIKKECDTSDIKD